MSVNALSEPEVNCFLRRKVKGCLSDEEQIAPVLAVSQSGSNDSRRGYARNRKLYCVGNVVKGVKARSVCGVAYVVCIGHAFNAVCPACERVCSEGWKPCTDNLEGQIRTGGVLNEGIFALNHRHICERLNLYAILKDADVEQGSGVKCALGDGELKVVAPRAWRTCANLEGIRRSFCCVLDDEGRGCGSECVLAGDVSVMRHTRDPQDSPITESAFCEHWEVGSLEIGAEDTLKLHF